MDERRFSDRQVREILKRAVEEVPTKALASGDGLTLAELKEVGAEVGIDADRMERAVRSLEGDRPTPARRILGASNVLNVERSVRGELGEDDSVDVLASIRRHYGKPGKVSEVGGGLEWSTTGEAGERLISISSRDGVTRVSGTSNISQLAIVTFLPATIMGTMATIFGVVDGANSGSLPQVLLFLTILPVLLTLLRLVWGRISAWEEDKLHSAVAEVAGFIQE